MNSGAVFAGIGTVIAVVAVWLPLMDVLPWWHAGFVTIFTGAGIAAVLKVLRDKLRG